MTDRGTYIRSVLRRRIARATWRAIREFASPSQRRAIFAHELRLAFEELGPAFIKLGQLISVRPDAFAPEYVFEMEELRDSVTPIPVDVIREIVERETGRHLCELFTSFSDKPIGSASIAQVHKATLRKEYRTVRGTTIEAGAEVAVKVVRPDVASAIEADIALIARPVERLSRLVAIRRFNLPQILEELAGSMRSECDLRNEGRVADRFAFDFRDDPYAFTPEIVWTMTTPSVLVMRHIDGWTLSEARLAEQSGVDARMLALHGAEVFMRQVLVLGRFHADLHQSNLLITPDGRICYLDFGIVGVVEEHRKAAVAQMLAATVYGDADRALKYSAELGLVVPEHSKQIVRAQVDALMKATLGREPRDIKGFALGFLGIMNDERVDVPQGFGLLVKALVTVEGCAQAIYPDIDITSAARPYATRLIAQRMMSPARLYQRMPQAITALLEELSG